MTFNQFTPIANSQNYNIDLYVLKKIEETNDNSTDNSTIPSENPILENTVLEDLYANGTLRVKTKREKMLDPAYIDEINKRGEIFIRFRYDIIVPSMSLADIKSTLALRYFAKNDNSDKIKYTWRVTSLKAKSAVIKMDFDDPL